MRQLDLENVRRRQCPDDAEIFFEFADMLTEQGEYGDAEHAYLQLLDKREQSFFEAVHPGIHGYLARTNLAIVHFRQGRLADAEQQCWAVLEENPGFFKAFWLLGELYLKQGRFQEMEQVISQPCTAPEWQMVREMLRARAQLARKETAAARRLLQDVADKYPNELEPRLPLAKLLLDEGTDLEATEKVLREILALEPKHMLAKQDLEKIVERRRQAAS